MFTPATGSRPWRAIATAALVITTLFSLGCQPTSTSTPGPTQAEPSASVVAPSMPPASTGPAATAAAALCLSGALAVSGGPWGAAAGSRGADIIVANQGDVACTLTATAQVAIVDDTSEPIVQSDPSTDGGPLLDPGESAAFTILFGNWCDESAALPLHVLVRTADAGLQVQGLDLTASDLPPCNGPDQPPVLNVQPWVET
jgi:hypothetical protein